MPTSEIPDVGLDNQALAQDRVDDIGQTRRGRPATHSARCLYSSSHRSPPSCTSSPDTRVHALPAGIICRLGSILRRQHKNFAEPIQDQPSQRTPARIARARLCASYAATPLLAAIATS
jgi:hypothetical protein